MSADKERIAELVKDVQVAKGQYQGACDIINDLERKLAEQQAVYLSLQDFAIWLTGCGDVFTQHQYYMSNRHLLCASNGAKELTNLLAKAKEEGRKEAVPEGWQVVPQIPTLMMQERLAALMEYPAIVRGYKAMLAAAPKPQGETK